MKKLLLTLIICFTFGMMADAQTSTDLYTPSILVQEFTFDNGDAGMRIVRQSTGHLNWKSWQFNYSMTEYRNGVRVPQTSWTQSVPMLQADTIKDVWYNGNTYTNTVFWFSKQVVTMPLPLFEAMGIHMYYDKVDPDSLFINPN